MENLSVSFRKLKQQHSLFLLALFCMLAGGIVFIVSAGAIDNNIELDRILQLVAVLDTVASLLLGFNIFRKKMMQARNYEGSETTRFALYRTACTVWWAMIFVPGLLGMLFFVITGSYSFVALAVVHLLILLAFMPRKDNITVLLRFSAGSLD